MYISAKMKGRTDLGRAGVVASHPQCPRPAVRMTNSIAKCKPTLQPYDSHHDAPHCVPRVPFSRQGHLGDSQGSSRRTPTRERRRTAVGDAPNADGRFGIAFCSTVCACCVLGVMGRCPANYPTAHAQSCSHGVAQLRGFGGDPVGPKSLKARNHQRTNHEDPGELPHGWQYWASSVLDASFRKNSMLTNQLASRQAHLLSHSGRNAGVALSH